MGAVTALSQAVQGCLWLQKYTINVISLFLFNWLMVYLCICRYSVFRTKTLAISKWAKLVMSFVCIFSSITRSCDLTLSCHVIA